MNFDIANAITITATDEITLYSVIMSHGTTSPPDAGDDYDIAAGGVTVDGDVHAVSLSTALDDIDADDATSILYAMDIGPLTGTVFAFELDAGGTTVSDNDDVKITITYLARGDQTPVITIE